MASDNLWSACDYKGLNKDVAVWLPGRVGVPLAGLGVSLEPSAAEQWATFMSGGQTATLQGKMI